MSFDIFTDGSAINNCANAFAGVAFYIPSTKHLYRGAMRGTNNQAELTAIYKALTYIYDNRTVFDITNNTITLYSDSTYALNAVTGTHKAHTNVELINKCKELINKLSLTYSMRFVHVPAHTNKTDYASINNDIVDKAANRAAEFIASKTNVHSHS